MIRSLKKSIFSGKDRSGEIAPDEIFLDSSNLPQFDTHQFEGRIEKPISRRTVIFLGSFFLLIVLLFAGKAWKLQVAQGQFYADRSMRNTLRQSAIVPARGTISDANGVPLAWNEPFDSGAAASSTSSGTATTTDASPSMPQDFLSRKYASIPGLSILLGYVKYPKKDSSGVYYSNSIAPQAGIESAYDAQLSGTNGTKIVEVNAVGATQSESVVNPPKDGDNLKLTIDSRLQQQMYDYIKSTAESVGFHGGAGILMNVQTGEIVAMTSYPEYSSEVMTEGKDATAIQSYLTNPNNPFLDRPLSGLYTPGSIVKPVMAMAALDTHTISPDKQILSTGSISIPNPFDPTKKSVFNDWRPNGWMDIRKAIAVSSDVYFYEVGGGYQDQPGMGVANIDKYAALFGYGKAIPGDPFFGTRVGTVPSPDWKKLNFEGEAWNIGDTYHTTIGQYGWQVTPIQAIRTIAAIANGGFLLNPVIIKSENSAKQGIQLNLDQNEFQIVREGMREGALIGTSKGLDVPYVKVAGKTGTAELGTQKKFVNAWAVGFFPYDNPHYAYAVLMEKGPETNTIGGVYVMRQLLDWMSVNAPEYFK